MLCALSQTLEQEATHFLKRKKQVASPYLKVYSFIKFILKFQE